MDAFSEILSTVKLSGALFFQAEFTAPWGTTSPPKQELASLLCPGAPHLIMYHLVVEGHGFAQIGGRCVPLSPGDLVVLPHGDVHSLISGPHASPKSETAAILRKVQSRDLSPLQAGGGGSKTHFICGYLTCDPELIRPILNGLPSAFKVNLRTDRAGEWIESSILHLVDQAARGGQGCEAMMAKLSEALFVDTLRRYVAGLPDEELGWLRAARDSAVGKSLSLLHRRVNHPWTIAELAKEVGLSRSALVERFTRYLSEPPMTYLMRWRLQLAARTLTRTSKGVAEVASEVGYESEAAFNRAFKREFGTPPARYRRERIARVSAAA